ncbi:MAG: response regulator [Anaerolineae bacterium]|nr:response regulator [Anaerolineae bacterium]
MSKKQLHNRLNALFSALEDVLENPGQPDGRAVPEGWVWEASVDGLYTSCSPEVWHILGTPADQWLGQSMTTYSLDRSSGIALQAALDSKVFPIDLLINFHHIDNKTVPVRMTIFKQISPDGNEIGYRGFAQVMDLPPKDEERIQSIPESVALFPQESIGATTSPLHNYIQTSSMIAVEPWSDIAKKSIQTGEMVVRSTDGVEPALIAAPIKLGKDPVGIIELLEKDGKKWTQDETILVREVLNQLGLALENVQLYNTVQQELMERIKAEKTTQKALQETGMLYQISDGISKSTTPQELVSLLARTVLPENADSLSIIALNHFNTDQAELEFLAYHNRKGDDQRTGMHIPVSALPMVKKMGIDPIVIPDVYESDLDTLSKSTLIQFNIKSLIFLPMRSANHLIGILSVCAHYPQTFIEEDIRLLKVAAGSITVAIERQQLLTEAQRRALELQTASEITRDTTSTLALDLILERIVNSLINRFGFYHAGIYFIDKTERYAIVQEASGDAGADMKKAEFKVHINRKSIVGTVALTGEAVVANDVSQHPSYLPYPLLPLTKSELSLPLRQGQVIIGVLDIQSDRLNAFTLGDINVLQLLADQIAVAIENARSYELSQQAVEEIREADRLKSQFLANMSHELRTPLNSIIGFSRVILKGIDGPVNDVQKQDLSAIYNSGQHLLNLINDILDLSRIEAGKMDLSFEDIDLRDMVTSVMSTAKGLVKDKSIKLEQIIPDDAPKVRADPVRIRQVLLNFLSNAAKFTEEGSITIEVSSEINSEGFKEIFVGVTDTGPGISPKDQHKLFLPFSQVDDSPTRKTGGTGLGLSICRSLIELHGGRIGLLRSEVGVGSTFYFTLPITQEEEATLLVNDISPGDQTILCIDDDSQITSLYTRYLSPHGFHVVAESNPHNAIKKAIEVEPAVITVDIMMPEMDGWQVVRELKNNPETRHIPVVICSILEETEKGYSLGVADYLVKPFLQEDLYRSINRIIEGKQINKVLVIDDDEDDLRLVEKMLHEHGGFSVVPVNGGETAWEMILSESPDAIILDLFMPNTDGFTILEKLRADENLRSIPVVILTGAELDAEQTRKISDLGHLIIHKGSFAQAELLDQLEKTMRVMQVKTE